LLFTVGDISDLIETKKEQMLQHIIIIRTYYASVFVAVSHKRFHWS